MLASVVYIWLCHVLCSLALPVSESEPPPGNALLRTVYQFPNDTWVENLAMRSNGNLLVTLIQSPEVWEINPNREPPDAHLVFRFPDAISALGIAEIEPDVFAVNVGNWSDITDSPTVGSWSIWSLDLRRWNKDATRYGPEGHGCVTAKNIGDISEAVFLNGLSTLPRSPSLLMVADSGAGVIYRFDWRTGEYSTAIDNHALKTNRSDPIALGVNGVHVPAFAPDVLYATNSLKRPTFFRIPIDPFDGSQVGDVEVILESPTFPENGGGAADDFALDDNGHAWITSDPSNTLYRVSLQSGAVEVIARGANTSVVAGLTSCLFGITEADKIRGRLFVVTNGGLASPPSTGIVGGKVLALNTVDLQIRQ